MEENNRNSSRRNDPVRRRNAARRTAAGASIQKVQRRDEQTPRRGKDGAESRPRSGKNDGRGGRSRSDSLRDGRSRSRSDRRGENRSESRSRASANAGRTARRADERRRRSGGKPGVRHLQVSRQKLYVLGGVLIAVILWYCFVANSYSKRFLPHTYINGFDVGKMSAADAEAILKKTVETYTLELGFRGGGEESISSKDVDLTYVSSNEVEKILSEQNRAGWIRNFFGKRSTYTVSTSFRFDAEKMRSYLEALPEFQAEQITKPRDARIVRRVNNTFQVATEVEGNEPNEDVIFDAVQKSINASETRLNLATVEGAYIEPEVKADNEDLTYTADRFNSFVNCNISITRKDGTVESYGRDDFVEWVQFDEATGNWSLSKETVYSKCWAIMNAIAEADNHYTTIVGYDSKYSGHVVLPCAGYGYVVDVENETDKMYEALIERKDADITIENSVNETFDPRGDGTYVEIDITNQVLTYFRDYEVYMEMACVTGRENYEERRTPSGVFSVFDKQEDTVLGSFTSVDPGQRYESHVDVWMPFFESYGMHDASWRENFGGGWYFEYGSHGCVNLPPDEARMLFNAIEIWTPVIVLREGDNAPEGTKRGNTTWNPPDGGIIYG